MPVEQTLPPTLVEVKGTAQKAVSNGYLNVEITITPGADGWPTDTELDQHLLELFTLVAQGNWVGTVNKRYISENLLSPSPDPAPTTTTTTDPTAP